MKKGLRPPLEDDGQLLPRDLQELCGIAVMLDMRPFVSKLGTVFKSFTEIISPERLHVPVRFHKFQ